MNQFDIIDLDLLKYINNSTYYTNILLLPSLVLFGIINYKLTYMIDKKIKYSEINNNFKLYFVFCFILLFIGILTSSMYHYLMYYNKPNSILKIFGLLDKFITAPFIILVTLILVINYIIFYIDTNTNTDNNKSDNILFIIFMMGVIYSIFGVIIYIYKSKYKFMSFDFILNTAQSGLINNSILHTMFHYISYFGLFIILIIYYINLDNIANWFDNNSKYEYYYFVISIGIICLALLLKFIYKYIK